MIGTPSVQSLVGTWRHAAPRDSDDYLSEYVVAIEASAPLVSGHDLSDGERFVISQVHWDGSVLSFHSLMPSTGREGRNEFRLLANGDVESRFAFTLVEPLHRAAP
jgi:hypothetical protein